MNFLKKNYKLFLLCIVIAYVVSVFISQQQMLSSYNAQIKNLDKQIASEEKTKEELNQTREHINSLEYIEKIAREKLGMYLPNERVYIDIGK